MDEVGARLARVRGRIGAAAARSGRQAEQIRLLAVSKTMSADRIQQAVDAGVEALGENRVQEALGKIPLVRGTPQWHLIGRLQSNKARKAAASFDAIHSLDRAALISRVDAAARDADRQLESYVQVEFARSGASDDDIARQAREACLAADAAESLSLQGLMTLPPFDPDPERARPYFRRLAALRDEIEAATGLTLPGLSMGMSNDFEVAIEEGATIVRVGTGIFGARA